MSVQAAAVRLVDLRETPLDVAEVVASVADRRAGGVDVFIGTVRDRDHEHDVVGLEYAAHPTALTRLREVADAVSDKHDVIAISAVHRIGLLAIGDVAVVVAAAAVHRAEAFDATRALIDELKGTVPIWKHQRFTDGTDEWVGTP